MEQYAQALNYGIPFFISLILIEMVYSHWKGIETYRITDSISSLSSGITNITKDILGLSIVIISYDTLEKHLGFFEIQNTALVVILTFIGKDFAGYWNHRMEHKINIFWNRHIIHHSSEEYNLPCALRQSISVIFSFFAIFLLPLAILGVPSSVIGIVAPIHLFMQFWYHTKTIGKLGFLEKIIVTPSHHRVHHAINPEYIDKNFSQIFIVWDKLFGTFQEELDHVRPVYGVKKAVNTWNPIIINFQHLWQLSKDSFHAKNWSDKLLIWVKPTGWRPSDVSLKYPLESTKNVFEQVKYHIESTLALKLWSFIQLLVTLFLSMFLFNHISDLSKQHVILYGFIIFLTVFSYTSLMDKKKYTLIAETTKFIIAISFIYKTNDWFGINQYFQQSTLILLFYFSLSFILSIYFIYFEHSDFKEQEIVS